MRNGEITTIQGVWSETDNAWVSETLHLTGSCWLEVTLPDKGRVVIKKGESADGPFPKALISGWSGPDFRIRIIHESVKDVYVKICLTKSPSTIQIANF